MSYSSDRWSRPWAFSPPWDAVLQEAVSAFRSFDGGVATAGSLVRFDSDPPRLEGATADWMARVEVPSVPPVERTCRSSWCRR